MFNKLGHKVSTFHVQLVFTFLFMNFFNRERYHFLFSTVVANGMLTFVNFWNILKCIIWYCVLIIEGMLDE